MSVYKEGYHIIAAIMNQSRQIFPDAADFGVPVVKGDVTWLLAKQLVDWYGVKGSRQHSKYSTGESVEVRVDLMDEWAVSDGRMSEDEALERYKVYYTTCSYKLNGEKIDGIISVEKLIFE